MVSDRSNGINWSVIAALAGLILIGAGEPPEPGERAQNSQTAAKIQKASKPITSPIVQLAKPTEKDGGCQEGKDKRDSDLCAQWKAADAASDAAQYAFWTLLMSGLGTALLVWTLWETRQTSRRELRAYVKLEVNGSSLDLTEGRKIQIPLSVVNYGHTPARNASFQQTCGIEKANWKWDRAAKKNKNIAITLHRDAPVTCYIESDFCLSEAHIENVKSGVSSIFARGTYFYDDVFGRSHITQISLEVGKPEIEVGRVRIAPTGNLAT